MPHLMFTDKDRNSLDKAGVSPNSDKPKQTAPKTPKKTVPTDRKLKSPATPAPKNIVTLSERCLMTHQENAYTAFRNASSSGSIGASHNLVTRFVDYFDTTGVVGNPYRAFLWNPKQTFISAQVPAGSSTFSAGGHQIKGFKLEVLPTFLVGGVEGTCTCLFGVPLLTANANLSDSDAKYTCSQQRTTTVTPTSNPEWITVGYWKNIDPVELCANANGNLTLANISMLDSDSLTATDRPFQFRASITVEISLPLLSYAEFAVPVLDTMVWNGPAPGETAVTATQSEILGVNPVKF